MKMSGKHVLVLGMARSGRAAVELLLRNGARVCAYDRTPSALEGLPASVETICAEALPDFTRFDTVVQSPGVRVDASAKLVPEVDLAAQFVDAPLVGITGSNGKSTTTVLVGHMLAKSGFDTGVGGNLGTALCALVGRGHSRIVAELSSFQLEHARLQSAHVAPGAGDQVLGARAVVGGFWRGGSGIARGDAALLGLDFIADLGGERASHSPCLAGIAPELSGHLWQLLRTQHDEPKGKDQCQFPETDFEHR